MMKGVLLCGGEGTRLRPLTEVVNKHLIRVLDLPMAEYPLRKMIEAGIRDFLIVSGGENFAAVVKYFGSGAKWGVRIMHAIQDQPGGIAQAIGLAESFVGQDKFMVCLGDNIWRQNLRSDVLYFDLMGRGATFFSSKTETPERFGVLQLDRNMHPIDIIEKPKEYVSDQAVAGIYLYSPGVFDLIRDLRPSRRGELEVTDVNRQYIIKGDARIVELEGWWSDCGTIETLLRTEEKLKHDRTIPPLHTQKSG